MTDQVEVQPLALGQPVALLAHHIGLGLMMPRLTTVATLKTSTYS